jgi:hypothetical protein
MVVKQCSVQSVIYYSVKIDFPEEEVLGPGQRHEGEIRCVPYV